MFKLLEESSFTFLDTDTESKESTQYLTRTMCLAEKGKSVETKQIPVDTSTFQPNALISGTPSSHRAWTAILCSPHCARLQQFLLLRNPSACILSLCTQIQCLKQGYVQVTISLSPLLAFSGKTSRLLTATSSVSTGAVLLSPD